MIYLHKNLWLGAILTLLLACVAFGAPGDLDVPFNPVISLNGTAPYVHVVKVQPDGKILVGGQFTTFNGTGRICIARANQDGSLDTSFTSQLQPQTGGTIGAVLDIAIQADGKILAAGYFNVAGQFRVLVRLNSDGSIDNSFTTNIGAGNIYKVVVQSDGKILIGSNDLSTVDGTPVNYFARLNSNGSLHTALGVTGQLPFNPFSFAVQTDGKIVVGGSYFLARLNPDGTDDAGFVRTLGDGVFLPVFYTVAIQQDGKILAGGSHNGGTFAAILIRVNSNGTRDTSFAPAFRDNTYVWSIAVQLDGKILVGGQFIRINNTIRGSIGRLNPNGTLDSFHPNPFGANNNVYSVAIQSDEKVLIAGDFTWVGDFDNPTRTGLARLLGGSVDPPAPTPREIVFTSFRDGISQIYGMNADGSNQVNLSNNTYEDSGPALSADGNRIVFTSLVLGEFNREIYVMNSDGTNRVQLTNNPATDYSPSFSPDGTKITFTSNRDGNSEIYVMNADGSNVVRLTNNSAEDADSSFSPDGTKIVFTSLRDGNLEIYLMNANGTAQVNLSNNPAGERQPAFGPDGTKIVFASDRNNSVDDVYVMNIDGTGQTRLTTDAAFDNQPAFSPNGLRIVFVSFRNNNEEIYVMNADGTNQIRLTTNTSYDDEPHWGIQPLPPPVRQTKMKIAGGNILVGSPGQGIILKSPGGICRRLSIDNAGEMLLTTITCP